MSVTALHVPFKRVFEPVVRVGEYVAFYDRDGKLRIFRVTHLEPVLPFILPMEVEPGRDNEVKLDQLELEDMQLGQWRLRVLDPLVKLRIRYPASILRYVGKGSVNLARATTLANRYGNLLEVYTFEDSVPTVIANVDADESVLARVEVAGIVYEVEEVTERPEKFTVVPVYQV